MEHPHFKMIKNQSSRPYEIHLSFDKLLSYTSLIQDVTLRNKNKFEAEIIPDLWEQGVQRQRLITKATIISRTAEFWNRVTLIHFRWATIQHNFDQIHMYM